MHEISIMQTALEMALTHAGQHNARKITKLGMRIGALTNVVADSLQFAFEALTPGTIAEGAVLEVEWTPLICQCGACRHRFEVIEMKYACPKCASLQSDILSGKELHVSFVEVEGND